MSEALIRTIRTFSTTLALSQNRTAQCGFCYYDQKGVISGQYGRFSKKLAKIGYFHKSGFESSFEEEISLSNI